MAKETLYKVFKALYTTYGEKQGTEIFKNLLDDIKVKTLKDFIK